MSSKRDVKTVRLTPEYLDGAIRVLRKSFFVEEQVCKCTCVLTGSPVIEETDEYKLTQAAKELEDLCLDCVQDGVSFVTIDENTDEVLGVAFNKIQVPPPPGELSYFETFAKNQIKDPAALGLVDYMIQVDSKYDLFKQHNVTCSLEVMFLAALQETKGQGVGQSVVQAAIDLAQNMKIKNTNPDSDIDVRTDAKEYSESEALGMVPRMVTAIFTSRFSQRIGQRTGMDVVVEIPYTEFEYNGRLYSETTGSFHSSCTLNCRVLD